MATYDAGVNSEALSWVLNTASDSSFLGERARIPSQREFFRKTFGGGTEEILKIEMS
jgi:hypothetical protein